MRRSTYSEHDPQETNFIEVRNFGAIGEVYHVRMQHKPLMFGNITGIWHVKRKFK